MITRLDQYRVASAQQGRVAAVVNRIAAWIQEVKSRRNLRRLRDLDRRILRDIGVTADDVEWALRLPWHHKAGVELQYVARLRRAALYR